MENATRLLYQAGQLIKQRDYNAAADVYMEATETDPTDIRAWFGLGICLYKVGNLEVAIIALEEAARMGHPRAAPALAKVRSEAQERSKRAADQAGKHAIPPLREKIHLESSLRIMLVENVEAHRAATEKAIADTIENVEVESTDFHPSTSDTLSMSVHYDVAIINWDSDPDAATALIDILKLKLPSIFILCLTPVWNPRAAARIFDTGADYYLAKEQHFAKIIPLVIAQWAQREQAISKRPALLRVAEEEPTAPPQEQLYESLTESANAAIIMVGPDGKLQYGNRHFCSMLEQTAAELLGQPVESIVPPPDQEALRECIDNAMELGQAESRLNLQRDDGSRIPTEARAARFRRNDEDHLVMTFVEVAGLEKAEVQLWSDMKKLTGILEDGVDRLQCGVVVLADGKIAWINSTAAEWFGADKNALQGKVYLDALDAELAGVSEKTDSFLDALRQAHGKGGYIEHYDLSMEGPAGGETVSYWSTPVERIGSDVSRIDHFYTVSRPTEPSYPEVSALPSLYKTLDALPDALFTLDAEGTINWSNRAARNITGHDEDVLRKMSFPELASEPARDSVRDLLQGALSNADEARCEEALMQRANGERFWAEITLVPERDGDEVTALHAILHDITERRLNDAIRSLLAGDEPPA